MDLDDFSADEDLALLGLMRAVIQADGDYSNEERAEVIALRDEMGADRFDSAIAGARERFGTLAALKEHAKSIHREPVRSTIMRRLMAVAASDGVDESEEAPIRWLAHAWPDAKLS